jgi:hypothetical protein
MTEKTEDRTVAHIDAALEAGEPLGVDVGELLADIGIMLQAAGRILHLQRHPFVERQDAAEHVEVLLHSVGSVLFSLSEDS